MTLLLGAVTCRPAPEASATRAPQTPTAEMEEGNVDWAAARRHQRLDDGMLPSSSAAALQGSSIPALLPPEENLVESAIVTAGPSWFSVSMQAEGYSVVVLGSNRGVRLPDDVELPHWGSDAMRVARAEGIAEVSFRAFGAVYTLSIECTDPENDPHCADDAYALELVEQLHLSGASLPD